MSVHPLVLENSSPQPLTFPFSPNLGLGYQPPCAPI
jgi:hypothetical protein